MAASKTLTAEQRTERARRAAKARTGLDYHIQRIKAAVDAEPPLTESQRNRLAAILAPVRIPVTELQARRAAEGGGESAA